MNEVKIKGTIGGFRRFEGDNYKKVAFTVSVPRENVKKEKLDNIEVVAWNDLADDIYNHFDEGEDITIYGSINRDCWKDANGSYMDKLRQECEKWFIKENNTDIDGFIKVFGRNYL